MSWNSLLQSTLSNDYVILKPITPSYVDALRSIAMDPEIWQYFVEQVNDEQGLQTFVQNAVNDTETNTRKVYVITDRLSGKVAGCMAYGNLDENNSRLEIGWSWLGRDFQGLDINAWSKLALLVNAFEQLGCERVEFKTDILNEKAIKGLQSIGATREGVFRSYNFMPSGRRRDAVYFSIIKTEWSKVKHNLYDMAQRKSAMRQSKL